MSLNDGIQGKKAIICNTSIGRYEIIDQFGILSYSIPGFMTGISAGTAGPRSAYQDQHTNISIPSSYTRSQETTNRKNCC